MRLDRGLMSRYVEHAGNTLGATVVAAMWRDAVTNGALISIDATGALIQPTKAKDGKSLACTKGHFFTAVVDADAAAVERLLRVGDHDARSQARPQPRHQGARLRAQPGGRPAPRPPRCRYPARHHPRRARPAQDRRRSQELAVLRHRQLCRGRRRLLAPRQLPPARPRPVRLPRRGPARRARVATRALPRELAPQHWAATRARLDPNDRARPLATFAPTPPASAAASPALPHRLAPRHMGFTLRLPYITRDGDPLPRLPPVQRPERPGGRQPVNEAALARSASGAPATGPSPAPAVPPAPRPALSSSTTASTDR